MLCELPLSPGTEYVQTYDELGRVQWWHMACRDQMIPFLLAKRDEGTGQEDDAL